MHSCCLAAFDTVDHCILLDRLEHFIGVTGNVLSWLRSYLSGRSQTVSFKNDLSETWAMRHGVPQGSVLGPLLFSMYLLPLGVLLRSFTFFYVLLTFHCYVNDLQLYVPLTFGNCAEVSKLESCLSAIRGWLSDNFLLLNTDKTEYLSKNFTQVLKATMGLQLDCRPILGPDIQVYVAQEVHWRMNVWEC
uniref:Reverse transcriptase domain-containing protein n=1 Tax=Neolamprologus brichardi TaxID=32507 RepID=A0A3Q4G0A8_NEOBR